MAKRRIKELNLDDKPGASEIDKFVISQVRKRRDDIGISALDLSQLIGAPDSFVSNTESRKSHSKYNVRHLNLLAIALKCSPRDFWPVEPIK